MRFINRSVSFVNLPTPYACRRKPKIIFKTGERTRIMILKRAKSENIKIVSSLKYGAIVIVQKFLGFRKV